MISRGEEMLNNYEIRNRLYSLKCKTEEQLEEILQEDLQEIIDLRETISIYEVKKERFDVLETEKNEVIRLLSEKINEKKVQQD